MPTKTSDHIEQKVLPPGRQAVKGHDVIGPKVGVPAGTVSRILRRHQVAYLRGCDR